MRIALIADTFPPLRTSGAVQLWDLSCEFARQGHQLTVMVPSAGDGSPTLAEHPNGIEVLRLRAPRTKDVNHVRRAASEYVMPFAMQRSLGRSRCAGVRWDGVVWYSPTIFLGPLAAALKHHSRCRSYLILRDIFPEWAVDLQIMGRGLPYHFFKIVERYQYSVADTIGVQSVGNLPYFDAWAAKPGRRVEVLQNWLGAGQERGCSISVAGTALAGRKIFVYAGNMGIAQGMDVLINLAGSLRGRSDVGFLFVGRGSEKERLVALARQRSLENVLFFDEIPPEEIPGLYAQCHVGLLALDPRHRTHNVPGKFLTYLRGGLPVLANVNPGNDLVELIDREDVGRVVVGGSAEIMQGMAEEIADKLTASDGLSVRCRALWASLYSSQQAVRQIVAAL